MWTPPTDGLRSDLVPHVLPVPWVNGAHPYDGDWVTFDEVRAVRAHQQRLCAVCGQPLNGITLLGRAADRITSGPGCHPNCMQLTLAACPIFTNPSDPTDANPAVAWRVDGPGLGYLAAGDGEKPYEGLQRVVEGLPEFTARDVRLLAGIDPWGTGRSETIDADDTVADG